MVAPLLAALGAYDCRWPPYASHVAFELWSKPSSSGDDKENPRRVLLENSGDAADAAGRGGDEGKGAADVQEEVDAGGNNPSPELSAEEGRGEKLGSGEGVARVDRGATVAEGEKEEEEEAFVRVTFQGQPVTHRITDCSTDPSEG